ncbi:MAG: hypothetical protein J6U10_06675 [Lachnospiraceae bacterium]|nr:hypothetical protein [Lachnospiraceae bacterium]
MAFISKNRNFILCCVIMAAVYLLDSLLFFSQFYLMYDFFDEKTISAVSTGWAYLAQGLGLALFILLYRTKSRLSARRMFQAALFLIEIPVIMVSILVPNKALLLVMIIILNIIVGLHTGFTFTLAAAQAPTSRLGLCYGLAYAVGAFGTWLISVINGGVMTSRHILYADILLIALIIFAIMMYRDAFTGEQKNGAKAETDTSGAPGVSGSPAGRRIIILLCLVIAIMAPISSIGTNNNLYVEYCRELDLLAQRSFYAVGLIAAGLVFDRNRTVSGICSVVSLIYPIVLIMIYRESGLVKLVVGLSYVILGFFAVYRASSFMTFAAESKKLYLAPLGLAIARAFEAAAVLLLIEMNIDEMTSVILMSVLFIPLIILFFVMLKAEYTGPALPLEPQPVLSVDGRHAEFARQYGLTRREEEITGFLSEGRSNGEIAERLKLSESTVRFHVSNILKKTGMKDRNEVGRVYRSFL